MANKAHYIQAINIVFLFHTQQEVIDDLSVCILSLYVV